ncbi:hypothetical protein [Hyphomicrobium sp. LHD-15]|uniref:hypothetical protein n=1 Tax=Hyphomicrobium sp. LHD-15 TaxID=3072142 RepID=UPI00280DB04D|nr:hypothetical protein [Hyphomicrobium sp. LHD-15]MDQ8698196.1 hypothetical protein [Hyphomicrobium sp. LHD-15]
MKYATRLSVMAALCLLAVARPAQATGAFLCGIKDDSLKFSAESAFSHGLGERFMDFAASGTVLLKDAPKDLAELKFDDGALVHHWFAGGDLKLHLYREREGDAAHGYIELILETKQSPDDETVFQGTYKLQVYDTTNTKDGEGQKFEAEGKAACSVG